MKPPQKYSHTPQSFSIFDLHVTSAPLLWRLFHTAMGSVFFFLLANKHIYINSANRKHIIVLPNLTLRNCESLTNPHLFLYSHMSPRFIYVTPGYHSAFSSLSPVGYLWVAGKWKGCFNINCVNRDIRWFHFTKRGSWIGNCDERLRLMSLSL